MDIQIPPGLTELMQDFTVVALRERPTDIVEFAAEYFIKLRESKKQYGLDTQSKGVKFSSAQAANSDGDSSGEEPGQFIFFSNIALLLQSRCR